MKDFNESIKKVVAAINSAPPEQYTFVCESTPKHDGKLDEENEYTVSYGDVCVGLQSNSTFKWRYVPGIHIDGVDDTVHLIPKQALSLLAWLLQEQPTLEQLAKEQSGDG